MDNQTNTNPITPGNISPSPAGEQSAFTAAYERRLSEIQKVPESAFAPTNLDVHATIATVLGALPEILALKSGILALPDFDSAAVEGLEDYAMAAAEANSRSATSATPQEDIVALNSEALSLRDTLRSDASALAKRGLIDSARLSSFKGLVGYKNVGFELMDWANLLRDCWPQIQGKTALTSDELAHAKQIGERLVRAAGVREQAPVTEVEAAHIRQQAFGLLVNAYDQVRRAVGFLRWNIGDEDTIAPSLYAGRTRRTPAPPVVVTPGAPVVASVATPVAPVVAPEAVSAAPAAHAIATTPAAGVSSTSHMN
ncbi:MAG TPA: hypothetical protein VGI10_28175 [Polyangiaceae bacterium]